MNAALGTFYGVGVGPGDPDLITVKGLEILKRVGVIFAARTISPILGEQSPS